MESVFEPSVHTFVPRVPSFRVFDRWVNTAEEALVRKRVNNHVAVTVSQYVRREFAEATLGEFRYRCTRKVRGKLSPSFTRRDRDSTARVCLPIELETESCLEFFPPSDFRKRRVLCRDACTTAPLSADLAPRSQAARKVPLNLLRATF